MSMEFSHWEQEIITSRKGAIVVGAGLVGLSAAIEIKRREPSISVWVIDRQVVGAAASTRNAGFACFGSVSEIINDLDHYREEDVIKILYKRRRGISSLLKRFGAKNLSFEPCGGYEVFRNEEDFASCALRLEEINKMLSDEVFEICPSHPDFSCHNWSIVNKEEGHLNTGKLYGLLSEQARSIGVRTLRGCNVRNVDIENRTLEVEIDRKQLYMSADRLLIATNALTNSILPATDVTPVRNQVCVTGPIKDHNIKGTFHCDRGYIYFRDLGERLLIGGARNHFPDEETSRFGRNDDNIEYLRNFLSEYILSGSDIHIEHTWSGILSGGNNRLPIVRKLTQDVAVAVRMGGMGVAIGVDTGIEVATLLLDSSL